MAKREVTGWAGWAAFAGIMMIVGGFFQAIVGLTAIIKESFFVVSPNYLLNINVHAWGWVHLIWAIIIVLAGFAVLSGKVWGRVIGILIASITAIVNMYYIPYYPIWSLLIVAVDIIVIYSLAAHGGELSE